MLSCKDFIKVVELMKSMHILDLIKVWEGGLF